MLKKYIPVAVVAFALTAGVAFNTPVASADQTAPMEPYSVETYDPMMNQTDPMYQTDPNGQTGTGASDQGGTAGQTQQADDTNNNWWWLLPLLAIPILFLFLRPGREREEVTRYRPEMVGARGGKTRRGNLEDDDDDDNPLKRPA